MEIEREDKKPDELFTAFVLFKKTILKPGEKQKLMQTVRLVKAKDKKEAHEKMQAFWKDKMRSFDVIGFEINDIIQ